MDYIFVDLQGFKIQNNGFMVKEICVLSKNLKFHETIKAPYSFELLTSSERKNIDWITKNLHGLRWTSGCINQCELKKILETILHGKIIFVKGKEKVTWIREICSTEIIVINLEDLHCDSQLNIISETEKKECCHHKYIKKEKTIHCAKQNVQIMKKWFENSIFNKNNNIRD